jgi:hypothetical protein
MARMIPTEPKTALAGVMLEASFARFMTSMAVFSVERVISWLFDRLGLAPMVKTCGSCESTVWCGAVRKSPSSNGGRRVMKHRVQTAPFNEEKCIRGRGSDSVLRFDSPSSRA